jgi:hypothetical protein
VLAELEQVALLQRAPHGSGLAHELCGVATVTIPTSPAAASSIAVAIPYDGTKENDATNNALQQYVYLTLKADKGLDCRVRFGLAGVAAATATDWLLAAGDSLHVLCILTKETHFRVYGSVGSNDAPIASYYASGVNL